MNTVEKLTASGNAQVHVGDNHAFYQGDNKCLSDLRGTDPRLDKQRIEDIKVVC